MFSNAQALVIGITRYQHVAPLRASLNAEHLADALRDPRWGGYPPAAVQVITDARATRDGIREALDRITHGCREDSTVLIYYSGHGVSSRSTGTSSSYLVPVDATAGAAGNLEETAISAAELEARLAAIPAARLTVVLDCCYAAALGTLRLPELAATMARGRGRVVYAAARAAELAFALPGHQYSALTEALIEGLRGGVPARGGAVRVCDLFHYVQQRIAALPVDQHPVFRAELEENYPIALRDEPEWRARTVRRGRYLRRVRQRLPRRRR